MDFKGFVKRFLDDIRVESYSLRSKIHVAVNHCAHANRQL